MFRPRSCVVIAASVLSIAALAKTAAAQSASNAAIRGRVTDETSAALPGVTVTASSPALIGGQAVATTDVTGTYVLPDLPIGQYQVAYEISGFQRLARQGIILTAGFNAEVNVSLKVGSVAETITVVGASPVVDTTSTTPSVNLSAQILTEVLPVTRRIQDILTTTPGVSTRFAGDLGGGTSGGGAYTNYGIVGQTTVLMDGVNTRQDATIDQGTGNGPDVGTLEEMQVVTIGGSAEQALPGVFLNMIVKSGGNAFHGRYEAQGISDKFQDDNITPELRAQGISVGDAFKWSAEGSGDLGGRIIKDRLWFYLAARYRRTERTALGFVKDPGADGIWATSDDIPALRTGHDDNRTLKGTYQINSKFKAIGFYALHEEHFDPYPGQVTRLNPHHTTLTFDWNPHQVKGEIQGALSSRFLLNVLVGRQRYDASYNAQPGASGPRTSDQFTGLVLGANHSQDQRPRESWGPSGSASFLPSGSFFGRHELKAGFHLMLQDYATGRPDGPGGNYDLIFDNGRPLQLRTFNYPIFPQNRLNEGGAYLQDTWRAGERTTINMGLRWDSFHSWVPAQSKPQGQFGNAGSYPEVDAIVWRELATRWGIAYDLLGDGKTVLKASWGRYNHSPGDAFADAYNKNTISTTVYRWNDPNRNGDYEPGEVNLDTNGPDFVSITAATNNLLAQGLKDPRTYQATVSVDRELMANFGARISYVYVRQADPYQTINVLRPYEFYDVSIPRVDPGPDGLVGTADDGGMVTVYDYPAAYRGSNFVGNQRVTGPDDRDARLHTIEGVLNKRTTGRWGMLVALAASKNDRYLDGIAATPNQDYFPKDTTWEWQAKLTGSYEFPYKVNTSASFTAYSGVQGARTFTFTGIPSASTVALRLEPYGAYAGPVRELLNVKVARDFATGGNTRLRGSVEVLNALNSVSPWSLTFASGPNFLYWGMIDSPRIARGSVTFTF
jgi:Carboxypeptidase regulatory-like domain